MAKTALAIKYRPQTFDDMTLYKCLQLFYNIVLGGLIICMDIFIKQQI